MNKFVKVMAVIGISLAIVLVTMVSALAISVDANDDFILAPGDSIEGSFILSDYSDQTEITSDLRWLSFSESKYEPVINPQGLKVTDNSILIPYFISIPEEAEVGVYRTVVAISEGSVVHYLNIKVSVQKPFISAFFNFLKNLSIWWYIGAGVLITFVVMILVYNDD